MTTAQNGSFLTLHYRLAGPHGDIMSTFGGKPATLTLGSGELSAGLEAHLIGLAEGVHTTLHIPMGEAFGEHNPQMVQWVSRKLLDEFGDADEDYTLGDVVQFPLPPTADGAPAGRYAGTVLQVRGDGAVQIDFNHPLAGHSVTFEVQLIGVL